MESSDSIAVPMDVYRGRPYIDVILNGHPATFLIDTSAVTTLIDSQVLNAAANRSVVSLQIDDLRFPRLSPQPAAVRSYSETNLGAAADGIIGADLLAHYPIQFDFPDRILTIYRNSASAAIAVPKTAVAAPMRVIDNRPALEAVLDGDQGLWFSLSTGAGFETQLEPNADHAERLVHQQTVPFEEISDSGSTFGRLGRARSLVLGGVTFYQPLVAVLNLQRPGSQLSGALGADMLSRLNFFIDETSSSVSFVAGPAATSAFLYCPSGITLVWRHGAIVIRSVIPDSPADVAHLKSGDEVLSINSLAPATLDFARQLLDGSPGSKVVVVYRRWGITRSAELTLRVLI
jgi:PDZ domain